MSRENNWGNKTLKLGIIGSSLSHSLSPSLFQIVSNYHNINLVYLPFEIAESQLSEAILGLKALNFRGVNVTIPYKEKCFKFCDCLSEEAETIEAVNVLYFSNDKIYGYNTDIFGILESLSPYKEKLVKKNFLIIGAGGAAKSAVYTIIKEFSPFRIYLAVRNENKANEFANYFSKKLNFGNFETLNLNNEKIIDALTDSTCIVNCSPVGSFPNNDENPLGHFAIFKSHHIVFDMIYNPLDTKLIKLAKSQGVVAFSGLKMLTAQAYKAFEIWTGQKFAVDKIEKALRFYLTN
jgi:shikimate dehydrogenase